MKLAERLTFEIEYPVGTWTEITPIVEDVVLVKQREDGQYFYRLDLETELLLKKAAWDFISEIEENDHCAEIQIKITCGTIIIFEGEVSLNDGEFDFDNCQAIIKASTKDDYACIEKGLKQEVNILGSASSEVTLNMLIGELEYQTCPGSGTTTIFGLLPVNAPLEDSCLTDPDTWAVLENHFTFITPNGAGAIPPFTAEHRTVWVRQTVDSPTQPPGIGWVNIGGNTWVRKPATVFDQDNSTSPPPEESSWHQYYLVAWADRADIDNGVRLDNLLDFFLDEIGCDLTVVSNFFSINQDGTQPSNDAYTAALEKMQDVIIFQKSDVKRSDVTNNATIGKMTLEELFTLFLVLDVFPSLDATSGILRIEHISYYENKPISLDLTLPEYERWVKRSRKYSYANDNNPRFEKFSAMETTNNANFDGVPIDYGNGCSSRDNDTAQHNAGRFVFDLAAVITTPDSFSDDGFVVVNAIEFNSELYADTELAAISGEEILNGHLSFPNIHDKYWRNYAFQPTGLLNNTSVTFESVRPNKRGVVITIIGWCCDDFAGFDPATLVATPLGNGEVEKVTYSVKSGRVTFELIYGNTTTS